MKVYAFDVDETLALSGGPISIADVFQLHNEGHIIGLCGNWAMVVQHIPDWYLFISFIGPMTMTKRGFLRQIKQYISANDYIMVGNILNITGMSDDKGAADGAGWRFISEQEFAEGKR